jgi:uncharacterized membrane protein
MADGVLKFSVRLLTVAVWLSSGIFGLYILAFYFKSLLLGLTNRWNEVLPGLYDESTQLATGGMGIHFAAGGLILVLGSLQFIDQIRYKKPIIHRWIGRTYVLACILAAVGGLFFIFQKGTIGGWIMDLGFAGYGILMLVAAVQTIRKARIRDFDNHKNWAIRLYALAIGSWLYRMDYGFWHAVSGLAGHTDGFKGPFDFFMDFWFYLPNLLVAELIIREKQITISPFFAIITSIFLLGVIVFILLASKVFWDHYWGDPVLQLFSMQ